MGDSDRVLWSEGLFLRPQHFQQQDRHTAALVRGALQAGPLQTWGFRSLVLMATLPGVPLYRSFGFREVNRTRVPLPDGVTLAGVEMDYPLD